MSELATNLRTLVRERAYTQSTVFVGLLVAILALGGGLVLAFGGPLVAVALLLGLIAGIVILRDIEIGFWGVIAVMCLLPFATLPFDIGVTPTFLDVALGGVIGVWIVQLVTGRQRDVVASPITLPIIIFLIVAIFAFIFGLNNGPLTGTLLRKFAELLLSIGFVIVIVDYCRDWRRLERAVRVLMMGGGAAGAVATGLWLLPEDTANAILNAMTRLGYPGGFVIRYIEENPELSERAIGTSIDPNALGGLLIVIGILVGPQLLAERPLLQRRWTWLIFGLIFVAVLLTFSRGAFLALLAGLGVIALLRYPRLIPWMVIGGLGLFVSPPASGFRERLLEGLQGTDLASQMRIGEITDALELIGRYPLFGVGFAGSPDIDLYLGVANVYLSIAQQMGILGLGTFVLIIVVLYGYAFLNRRILAGNPRTDPVWLGLHAAVFGGLVAGLFDHYLFNTEFHHTVTIFWMMVGLSIASTMLGSKMSEEYEHGEHL